jgi:AAA+ ATPase superfamily predicted ATPase
MRITNFTKLAYSAEKEGRREGRKERYKICWTVIRMILNFGKIL